MIYVDIVSDTICPWCYIGKPFRARARPQWPRRRGDLLAAVPAQSRHAARRHDARRLRARQVRWRRPAPADLPGDRRERPRSRHRVRLLAHPAHAQYRAIAPPDLLERQEPASGRGRGRVVQGLLRARPRYRRHRHPGRACWPGACARRFLRATRAGRLRRHARRLGINGVPCFIVNRKYAVSGAQPPSAFVEVFNLAERDAATSTAQSTA